MIKGSPVLKFLRPRNLRKAVRVCNISKIQVILAQPALQNLVRRNPSLFHNSLVLNCTVNGPGLKFLLLSTCRSKMKFWDTNRLQSKIPLPMGEYWVLYDKWTLSPQLWSDKFRPWAISAGGTPQIGTFVWWVLWDLYTNWILGCFMVHR